MPPFPIIDTHVHLLDPGKLSYPEIAAVPAIHRTQLMPDLDRARGGVEIDGLVFVEVAVAEDQQVAEADFAAELAAADRRIRAIVAAAPVERGAEVEGQIERMAQSGLLRGIRRLIQNNPDPEFCIRPGFVEGVRCVGRHGLHFEICITHHQLGAALELARLCPEVPMILDHIGKPGIAHNLVEPWWSQIRALADLSHVHCKVSGVITEDLHDHWTESHVRPYIARIFDVFGSDRVMFGSDWPVSELTHRYAEWVAILDRFLAGSSEDERRFFFRDNAIDFYRLG